MARIYCPTGCGSRSFRVTRRGVIAVEVEVQEETNEMTVGTPIAEAGGQAWVACTNCGHNWQSRAAALEGIAEFLEGGW